jgi:hypothetical protein
VARVIEILQEQVPRTGETELRHFEWHLLAPALRLGPPHAGLHPRAQGEIAPLALS